VPIDDLTLKQVLMQAINNRDFNIVRKWECEIYGN
jgi:hypothetical protein